MMKKWVAGIACVLGVSSLWAADFEVGRAKVQLTGQGWRSLEMKDGGQAYDSRGMTDSIPSETKVFIKEGANKSLETVLLVRSSQSGIANGWMVYSPQCESSENFFAEGNSGARTSYMECLRVWPFFGQGGWVDEFMPGISDTLKSASLTSPPGLQPIISHYANGNSTFVEVRALIAPDFAGLEGKAPDNAPAMIIPSSIVWGQALAKAVRSSVSSMSGRLEMPQIQFSSAVDTLNSPKN